MAAVFLLLGLLYLMVYLLKRMSGRGGFKLFKRGELELEGQLPLGPKRSVVVVRFLNKRMVLGVTDTHINLLHTMETGHDKDSKTFSQTLAEADPGSGVSGEEPREDNTVVETPATDPDDA
ncbi:MAG: flagellar biosynthetic protein FliO [Desulfovibrio sp.]|nr:MAG: flagellar biosynthetic protein FliO [Desulfovibrio sp.]